MTRPARGQRWSGSHRGPGAAVPGYHPDARSGAGHGSRSALGEASPDRPALACDLGEDLSRTLLGTERPAFLNLLRDQLGVRGHARGDRLQLHGPAGRCELVAQSLGELRGRAESGEMVGLADLRYLIGEAMREPGATGPSGDDAVAPADVPCLQTFGGNRIVAKTSNQARYLRMLRTEPLVIALGPAGTGKTFLAVAMAVLALRERRVNRIVLSRPTIEAGERLGFLPGDLLEKVDPYFRPLYDALVDFLGVARFRQLMDRTTIEVTPLAYMRGRTFNESMVILDEAQNTTMPQLKMFLTRMGNGSRVVVTGDPTQIDLPHPEDSALHTLPDILAGIAGISFVHLGPQDVVRNSLVQAIVEAYASYQERCSGRPSQGTPARVPAMARPASEVAG